MTKMPKNSKKRAEKHKKTTDYVDKNKKMSYNKKVENFRKSFKYTQEYKK